MLAAARAFMDYMDYGFDDLYHGRYSATYGRKVPDALTQGRTAAKDRIPCDTKRVEEGEANFRGALRRAEMFYPTAFESFAAMKDVIACGKTIRAWTFFVARCLFDRLGELMGPEGFLEKYLRIAPISTALGRSAKAVRDGAWLFEKTGSHLHEAAVLIPKLREACLAFMTFSPEARRPQLSRRDPDEVRAIMGGMADVCLFLERHVHQSPTRRRVQFSEYAQDTLLPQWKAARDSAVLSDIVREIRSRRVTGPQDPRVASARRLNALLL
jgi:hypothetical protein